MVSLALKRFKEQCQNRTGLVATDNSTVIAYINKQGGTHSAEMCALLWKIIYLMPSLPDNLKSQANPRVPDCDGRPTVPINRRVTASAGVQTDLSKWFTPHVDLFATRLNHKVPLYVSPVPNQHAWDIDALNITGRVSLLMLTLPWLSFTG